MTFSYQIVGLQTKRNVFLDHKFIKCLIYILVQLTSDTWKLAES